MAKRHPCTRRDGSRKERWPNEEAAQFVADWKRLKFGNALKVYQCPACGGWHLATDHSEPQDRQSERRRRLAEKARVEKRKRAGG